MHANVLVTGASGFVGQSLCAELVRRSSIVRGTFRSIVKTMPPQGVVPVFVDDVNSQTDWSEALREIEVVVHLAARVHVMRDKATDPLAEFHRTNVEGTLNLASQAASAGARRFIFISSIGVNGSETNTTPFRADSTVMPHSPYAQSKYEAELGLRDLAKKEDMDVVIIRPPLVYGPNAPGNFGMLMRWISRGVPLPLGAVTYNRRSLVALDNLVDLIITCLTHPAAANQTFLVSDGEDLSTADLLRRMGGAMGCPVRLLPVPSVFLRLGAIALGKPELIQRLMSSLQVDITKTRKLLDWDPPVSLDEGLKRIVGKGKCKSTFRH